MQGLIATILASILVTLASHFLLSGNVYSLIPWTIFGLGLGFYFKNRKQAVIWTAVYGFIISFVFMLMGYRGTKSVISVIPFFILLGLFGAVCGAVLGFIGNFLKKFKK